MTVVIVHDPISINGVDYQRGDKIFGDDADAALENPIWARCVTRAPEGMHDLPEDSAVQIPPTPALAPVPLAAVATTATTMTDTTKQ